MKKSLIISYVFFVSQLICFASNGQKNLNLTVKFDNEFDRYEVYVKPNFSQRNFTWGPSQISLVLPANVLVEKLKISNVDGGTWEDNSIIQSPEITPELSYHGITSGGNKTDLTEGYESVLFYFSLPKNINSDKVRVFDNESDPKSIATGMMGGDFRNSIVDMTGKDWFSEIYTKEKTAIIENKEIADFEAVVFPNVITENKFKVTLKNINEEDGDILMILVNESGKELLRQKGSKAILEKQIVNLPASVNVQNLIVKFITTKGSISKRLLTEN